MRLITLHVGLAAYGANERFFWNQALVRCNVAVHPWDIKGPIPSEPLDAWVIVLDASSGPLSRMFWLRQLTAPTLLISPESEKALQASTPIQYPVLVCSPTIAKRSLQALIEMLTEITAGKLLLHDEMVPYSRCKTSSPRQNRRGRPANASDNELREL